MPPLAPPLPSCAEPLAGPLPAGLRAVVFDVVHTLVEPWPSVAVAYHEAGARHGVELDPAVIQPRFRAAWRRQEEFDAAQAPPFATSRLREADRWRQIVAEVFTDTAATDRIFADLWDHFGRPEAWRPVPAGQALVLAARRLGLPIVLASNFDERLLAVAPVLDPRIRGGGVFPSSEIGWRKPAAAFFRHLEERLGRLPGELLYVGDDPDLDVAAAAAAGWRSLLLT